LILVVVLELRPAIKKYCQNYKSELEDDKLTPEDWRQLCTIKDFLEPFQSATLYTKRDYTAINQVLFIIDILIKYFQLLLVSKISS
jgi:hypothetical protein